MRLIALREGRPRNGVGLVETTAAAPSRGHVLDSALARSPVQWIATRWTGRRLRVLAYHGIDDPKTFEEQVRYLASRYQPVSLAEVEAAVRGWQALPPRAVLLTFDDGHPSLLDVGAPILARHGVPAVAFVLPGLIGTTQPFWWDEVECARTSVLVSSGALEIGVQQFKRIPDTERRDRIRQLQEAGRRKARQLNPWDLGEIRAMGVEIGNHTWDHPCLPQCDPEMVEEQIERAHDRLSSWLGFAPTSFAFPNGDFDERARTVLGRLGYQLAFLFDHRLATLPVSDPLAISRVRVNSHTSIDRLKMILSGLHPQLHRLRGRS